MDRSIIAAALALAAACTPVNVNPDDTGTIDVELNLESVARMLSELPLGEEQLREVYDAAAASSGNGYDEEYMLRDVFEAPGTGVGDDASTKAGASKAYGHPLRDLITDYLRDRHATKSGGSDVDAYVRALTESGFQLYIPYSDQWDGKTFPIITFDPGYGAESNYGYEISLTEDGLHLVDSVYVDENIAMKRPVWVVNNNDDSAFTPLELYLDGHKGGPVTKAAGRMLYLKSFKMLRNYDSWFGGGSEFAFKVGSVNGFTASTEAELKLYSPTVTDFMIEVKRKDKGVDLPFNTIMLTDFTNQMDNLAFLVTEDDGGTVTSWKCSASVKIQSKTYGFDIDLPYHDKDDIVWRGQLSSDFLREEDIVRGRFGDVEITFALE